VKLEFIAAEAEFTNTSSLSVAFTSLLTPGSRTSHPYHLYIQLVESIDVTLQTNDSSWEAAALTFRAHTSADLQ